MHLYVFDIVTTLPHLSLLYTCCLLLTMPAFVEQARLDHVSDVECTDQAIEEMRQNYLISDLQEDSVMNMIP